MLLQFYYTGHRAGPARRRDTGQGSPNSKLLCPHVASSSLYNSAHHPAGPCQSFCLLPPASSIFIGVSLHRPSGLNHWPGDRTRFPAPLPAAEVGSQADAMRLRAQLPNQWDIFLVCTAPTLKPSRIHQEYLVSMNSAVVSGTPCEKQSLGKVLRLEGGALEPAAATSGPAPWSDRSHDTNHVTSWLRPSGSPPNHSDRKCAPSSPFLVSHSCQADFCLCTLVGCLLFPHAFRAPASHHTGLHPNVSSLKRASPLSLNHATIFLASSEIHHDLLVYLFVFVFHHSAVSPTRVRRGCALTSARPTDTQANRC